MCHSVLFCLAIRRLIKTQNRELVYEIDWQKGKLKMFLSFVNAT